MHWFDVGFNVDVNLLVRIHSQCNIKESLMLCENIELVTLLLCREVVLTINDISNVSPRVLGIKNFSGIRLQRILVEEFIFLLNVVHVFHVVKVSRRETFTWMHVECAIIPEHFATIIVKFDACFGKKISA